MFASSFSSTASAPLWPRSPGGGSWLCSHCSLLVELAAEVSPIVGTEMRCSCGLRDPGVILVGMRGLEVGAVVAGAEGGGWDVGFEMGE